MKSVQPNNIVLVHGTDNEMKKLKGQLEKDIKKNEWPGTHRPTITMPKNLESVTFQFRKNVEADLVGSLADAAMRAHSSGELVEDMMVHDL